MSLQTKWNYYNHAWIPATAPHEKADTGLLTDKSIWKKDGRKALFARWTTDFDCGYETGWWYCLKDTPYDITSLKSKRRYNVNKGMRYFECKRIDPIEYKEELYEVQKAAFTAYQNIYRPRIDHASFIKEIDRWSDFHVYGAFHRETGQLLGYAYLTVYPEYANLNVLKTNPAYERYQINAAIINQILEDFKEKLCRNYYIIQGERNLVHMTAFQEYLETYFGFRKAYCRLHIKYRPFAGIVVKCLYPFRRLIKRTDVNSFTHNVAAVLEMEEICRTFDGTGRCNG